jgi:chromatin remodeling complex protein RSC6
MAAGDELVAENKTAYSDLRTGFTAASRLDRETDIYHHSCEMMWSTFGQNIFQLERQRKRCLRRASRERRASLRGASSADDEDGEDEADQDQSAQEDEEEEEEEDEGEDDKPVQDEEEDEDAEEA